MLAADIGFEWNNDYACFREFYYEITPAVLGSLHTACYL